MSTDPKAKAEISCQKLKELEKVKKEQKRSIQDCRLDAIGSRLAINAQRVTNIDQRSYPQRKSHVAAL